MSEIKSVAVFTSGGDAPGMNAAIRAVVRTAIHHNLHVYGIQGGYDGMIKGDIRRMENHDVANIIHRGGTILQTARSQEFMTAEGRQIAFENLTDRNINACIAIGGNGTYTGAKIFQEEHGIPMMGVPGTIDNDIFGTDFSIGFDTAVNTAMEAVDRIRDTAASHSRLFFIEVMGRHSGFIALHAGIGSGAGHIFLPEEYENFEEFIAWLNRSKRRKKLFNLIIVSEGNTEGGAYELARLTQEQVEDIETKVSILGHLQRGGSPTAADRLLASRLGNAAVDALVAGISGKATGWSKGEIVFTSFEDAINKENRPTRELIDLAHILSQ